MNALVFGGTSEGRRLVEWLSARGTCGIVYCTATDYGASLVEGRENVTTLVGTLSADEKRRLVAEHDVVCIVDATHPYAAHISASIEELGKSCKLDVIRVARDGASAEETRWTSVTDAAAAARHVSRQDGNVLLTTGTKDLATFVEGIPNFEERLYMRILPVMASLARVEELRVPASHIIAMQGPFSVELNCALIRDLHVSSMVTKQSGRAGGFDQKVEAAVQTGIELVVIGRPPAAEGVTLEEACNLLEERYGW